MANNNNINNYNYDSHHIIFQKNQQNPCTSPPLHSPSITQSVVYNNLTTPNNANGHKQSSQESTVITSTSTKHNDENVTRANRITTDSMSRTSSTDDRDNNDLDLDDPNNADAYKERRRKNNEAAKRSRDARRAKEDDIALRAAILERENLQLKVELSQLKIELNQLRCLLYNS